MVESLAAGLLEVIGDSARVITATAVVDRLSKDFYWYSPVLKRQLADKVGDIVVQLRSTDEVLAVARFAGRNNIPITVRGAGTGNYGQCIPLHGGIVLDLALMDKLEEITPEGVAVCEPGLRLAPLEIEARKRGWELRMYPSTIAKASVGGFLAGGSGGIGSVAHGGLRDFGAGI
jgi:FAD/FMN-containing dehydrogenase